MSAISLSLPAEARRRERAPAYSPPYAAMVVDAKTGRVLHADNEDALRHPASITKVMTLYLLFEQLERGRLSLATPLHVSANAAQQPPSKLGLEPGETIAVEDAIKALVTKSANDIAVAVAENLAGSEEAFAAEMTRKARALGMSRTIYRNASGLPDPEQVTTARDLTILARAIQDRFPRYYQFFQIRTFTYAGRAHRNHNKLLGRVEGVDGIKTGFTRASGFNLMTSARTDDRHIVAVVLGGRSGASRDQAMAALVRSALPRAYAGARQAPVVAEAADRLRPFLGAEASRTGSEIGVETTATAPARPAPTAEAGGRRNSAPLDLASMRLAAVQGVPSDTAPSALPWKAGSPLPAAAQAYAATALDGSSEAAPAATPAAAKIQTRLTGLEALVAQLDAPKSEPAKSEPAKNEAARSEARVQVPGPRRDPGARREPPRPTVTGWVIQLGATDDEGKAKAILEQARSRSGRVLAKASAFTEKVVREGATLYRARFSGFQEADSAEAACKSLKRSGFNCFAIRS